MGRVLRRAWVPGKDGAQHVVTVVPGQRSVAAGSWAAGSWIVFRRKSAEDKFAAAGPAATAVLRHRATDPEVKDGAWSFDRGTASRDGRSSAWGKFSHVSEEGWHRDMLSIVANENGEGEWTVTHTIVRAKNA